MTQASNVGILTPKINSSGQLDATTGLTGAVPVANGGTGAATYTANNVLLGNGTSAFQTVAPSTNGNVLTSNGTTWVSSAPAGGGGLGGQTVFTSSGTFTIPTGKTVVKVSIVGGGGGASGWASGYGNTTAAGGGAGGTAVKYLTGLTPGNTLTVTVGSGGAGGSASGNGSTGGTSSVASGTQTITTISCTGGSGSTFIYPNSQQVVSGGAGGSASNGDINVNGGSGQSGTWLAGLGGCIPSILFVGGGGTSALFNSATQGYFWVDSTAQNNPQAGVGYGCGGRGSFTSNTTGGAGKGGIVIFEY